MLAKLEQKILQIKKAAGIEIIILEDNQLSINITTAMTSGHLIIKQKEINGLGNFEALKDIIDPAIPVSLVINGKGILIKKTNSNSENGIFQSVLPNANPTDFYYEYFKIKNEYIVTVARRETVSDIIREIEKIELKLLSVSIGFKEVLNILPFLKGDGEKHLESDSISVELDKDNQIIDFKSKEFYNNKYQEKEYLIANQYIKAANIFTFSAVAGLLASDLRITEGLNAKILPEERKEYRYFKIFRTAGWSALIFILTLLLLNFLVYNNYFNKNKLIAGENLLLGEQELKIKLLEKEIRHKEKFIEQSGWTKQNRTSYFADRIAGLVPDDVLLTSMQIYPVKTNLLTDEQNNFFKKDTILVAGISPDPVNLNLFMTNLKILPDFKEVSIRNYLVRNEKESGTFSMEIILK